MITFPPEFVITKYPGYYWNTVDCKLYTIKITGELRPMVFRTGNRWNHYRSGYQISHRGHRKFLSMDYLRTLQPQTIPVAENKK